MAISQSDMTSSSENIGAINVTPLIDILLVLLIIFMVITPLASHGIPAELPQAGQTRTPQTEPQIVLDISSGQHFLLNGEAVARRDLAGEVARLYQNRISQELFMRADGDVEFRDVALIMDDIRGANRSMHFGMLPKK